ncbi:two-component regulator propeller domain-containing protein [Balneolales bacterium ANBcel1]|nr:two-component regulator propeller domain-containing protein [Balneolales bacterium ANBcel1]
MKAIANAGLMYLFLLLCHPGGAAGQMEMDAMRFHHITDKDGLSQATISTILQGSYGYMWFGSRDGLNRYNGHEITIYKNDPNDTNSISFNEVSHLFESSDSTLWVATRRNGINRYNRKKDNFVQYTSEQFNQEGYAISHASVNDIVEDGNGHLWIGTLGGLNRLNPETERFQYYTHSPDDTNSISSDAVTALLYDRRGKLWVGTHFGLNLFDPYTETVTRFISDPDNPGSINANYIHTLYEDSDGVVWIGTRLGGLNRYDRESNSFESHTHNPDDPFSISGNSIFAIVEDHQGILWVGTENAGLNYFDRTHGRFYHYESDIGNPHSLNNNTVYSLFESDTRIIWIGTFNGGVNYIDRKPSRFQHIRHDPSRPHSINYNSVLSFYEDDSGDFWIGTDGGGLNHFDLETGQFSAWRHDPNNPNSLPSDVIFDITIGDDGDLWLATYRGGLSRFDPRSERFTNYRFDPENPNSINSNDIFALYFDRDEPHMLWVGTNGLGVNLMDTRTGKFTHFVPDPNDPYLQYNGYIRYFYEDSMGNFWIGNYGGAFASFDKETGRFAEYDLDDRYFQGNAVQAIHEDRLNRLWLANRGGGLKLFNREDYSTTSYTTRDGLPNNIVHGILEDDHGKLWLSTNNGISRFDPEEEAFQNYGLADGLQSLEFNPASFYRDTQGFMYFGGVNGYNRFHPDSIAAVGYVPPIVFTELLIFNQPVAIADEGSVLDRHISLTDQIVLSHDQSVVTFEYATLNYEVNKNDQYAYMLEGFDSDWNYVGNKRSATYTNLNPGEYTFRVRASNSSDVWGEEAAIGLVIVPPFWQTTWFYILSALAIAGLVTLGYRWRVRSIHERNRMLEEQVALHTRDLKETLEKLKETQAELVDKAHKAGMADVATNVLHNIGNILNSVNVSAVMIRELLGKSHLKGFRKANAMLKGNREDIRNFVLNDPKGEQLLNYYMALDQPVKEEYDELMVQIGRLSDKIQLIMDVVSAQQSYSMAGRIQNDLPLEPIIEDTLTLQDEMSQDSRLVIVRDFKEVDPVRVEKSKLVHVLINVLKNAREAIREAKPEKGVITLSTRQDEKYIYFSVHDNGIGISASQLEKVFTHGFSTKKSGHGYGLHSCANYMQEMGGFIQAASDGRGRGATFTIGMVRAAGGEQ